VAEEPHSGLDALPAASLQMHEAFWHARRDIERVLDWAKWTSAWLISLGILAVAYVFLWYRTIWIEVAGLADLLIGGAIFVATAFGVLWSSRKATRVVEEWREAVLPFLYTVKFELLPYSGPDREHDIWNRYRSIYKDFTRADPESLRTAWARFWTNSTLKFKEEVKGTKKRRHVFSVYCYVGDSWGLFVRRFDQADPVSKGQLESFKSEIEDRRKRSSETTIVVGAFSKAGFQPEAIEYAQSDEGAINKSFPIDLIQETDTGYSVVWVSSD
jgi:hypothetical protein